MRQGYAGSWLVTGLPGEAPIREGAVVFDDKCVVQVGARSALSADTWTETRAILMPGLINAHVHLELSKLRGETRSGGGFGPWVASMMARRDVLQPELDEEAIDAGISELLRAGTAAIGEVSNTLASVPLLSSAPLLGRVYHEVFGGSREAANAMLAGARARRAALEQWPRNLSYTLAPHTVYTLHAELLQELSKGRTSLHLSEHAAERTFLLDGTGPFADFLAQRGIPKSFVAPGLSPIDYALQLGLPHPRLLAVHLCATTRDELQRLATTGVDAVLCPRSNLFIELKLPPLFDILEAGLKPGLGTDSLASNTTLDVLAEAA
ncbi:MAG: amidohydrolase family protein, partial [Polyangiales bacterium]